MIQPPVVIWENPHLRTLCFKLIIELVVLDTRQEIEVPVTEKVEDILKAAIMMIVLIPVERILVHIIIAKMMIVIIPALLIDQTIPSIELNIIQKIIVEMTYILTVQEKCTTNLVVLIPMEMTLDKVAMANILDSLVQEHPDPIDQCPLDAGIIFLLYQVLQSKSMK